MFLPIALYSAVFSTNTLHLVILINIDYMMTLIIYENKYKESQNIERGLTSEFNFF